MPNLLSLLKNAGAVFLVLACLIPILYFPISPDLAVFALGGQILLDGGVIYADFVDIKPPLIYYLLAAAQAIFGTSEVGIRAFDYVWQAATCFSLIVLLRRAGYSRVYGYCAAILYALVYTSHSYASTMQCESFAALPLVWALALMSLPAKSRTHLLVVGFLCGTVFSLKYTLGIITVAFFCWDLLNGRPHVRELLSRWMLITTGFLAAVGIFIFLPLLQEGAWHAFLLVAEFTMNYNTASSLDISFIRETLKQIPQYFADQYSLLLALGLVVFLLKTIGGGIQRQTKNQGWVSLAIMCILCLLVSVVVERKMFAYHFSRMLVLLVPLSAIGLLQIVKSLRSSTAQHGLINPLVIFVLILMALVFSPLARYVNLLRPVVHYHSNMAAFDEFYERPELDRSVIRVQHMQLAEFVNSLTSAEDEVLVLSTHAAMINFKLDQAKPQRLPGMQTFALPSAPQIWRDEVYARMQQADLLIIQINDRFDLVNAGNATSAEMLEADDIARSILRANFRELRRFESFIVYGAMDKWQVFNSSQKRLDAD